MSKTNIKKLLLIAPKYFGYEDVIKDELVKYGYEVTLIYENLDYFSFYFKFVKSRLPQKMIVVADSYFYKSIIKCNSKTDIVLVIRGEFLSCKMITFMKKYFKSECKYILYQWDSVRNNPNSIAIANKFDRVLSFDMNDCKTYGWIYRPLFFIDDYICKQKKCIDLLYLCSLHSERVKILNQLKKICLTNNLTYKVVLYENKILYFKRKYIDRNREYIYASNTDITFKPLSIRETYNLYGKAKAVVDFTHLGQNGYTMRTIECIGNNCKLITNNALIEEADFYNKMNFWIYTNSLRIPLGFVESGYEDNIYIKEKYSIKVFLKDLLGVI